MWKDSKLWNSKICFSNCIMYKIYLNVLQTKKQFWVDIMYLCFRLPLGLWNRLVITLYRFCQLCMKTRSMLIRFIECCIERETGAFWKEWSLLRFPQPPSSHLLFFLSLFFHFISLLFIHPHETTFISIFYCISS